jgi:predicted N-acetyltransferase YhbS
VALRRVEDDVYYLKRMYVWPDQRGAGLGAALLATELDFARSRGARAVHLDTSTSMEAAQRLYERAGFRRTGTRTEEGPQTAGARSSIPLDPASRAEHKHTPSLEFGPSIPRMGAQPWIHRWPTALRA